MEEVVLCGASAYNKKFYLNEDFKGLPEQIKNELKIMCVLFTEDVGESGRGWPDSHLIEPYSPGAMVRPTT